MQAKTSSTQSADGLRIGLVVSRYHGEVTARLEAGARAAFAERGGRSDHLLVASAPGTFELPVLASCLVWEMMIDAVVALGCVITGETAHDEYISHAVAGALADLSVERRKPIAFGVLTCRTMEQAVARAGGERGNKGAEAMIAAIDAVHALQAIRRGGAL